MMSRIQPLDPTTASRIAADLDFVVEIVSEHRQCAGAEARSDGHALVLQMLLAPHVLRWSGPRREAARVFTVWHRGACRQSWRRAGESCMSTLTHPGRAVHMPVSVA